MKNKYISLIMMALVCVLSLGFTACGSDDDDDNTPAPTVTLTEANIEGTELCTQANIVAQGRTASIVINIYDAAGKTLKASQSVTDSKYINVLNIPEFHVHVDIAGKNVAEGDLLKLTVADAKGQKTTAQKTITAEEEDEEDEHHHDE